jgi:hypothetical protein
MASTWRPTTAFCLLVSCFLAGHRTTNSTFAGNLIATDAPVVTQDDIESDWLRQAHLRYGNHHGSVTASQDAAGGCDGTINGKWGFHTAFEDSPWWQVDLGQSMPLSQLILYNRCDGGFAQRARHFQVLYSNDGQSFDIVYQHDGSVFHGHVDGKPLAVNLPDVATRYVRLQLPGQNYFHLDEILLFNSKQQNVAAGKPALQSSISQWSQCHENTAESIDWPSVLGQTIHRGRQLAEALARLGVDVTQAKSEFADLANSVQHPSSDCTAARWQSHYFAARRTIRQLALANPLLDFDDIVFVKRAPSMFPHLSDQYYGWWARPGGGVFVLKNFKGEHAELKHLTDSWPSGNFMSPDLDYDAARVLVAFSQHFSHVPDIKNKRVKENVPEEAFYHLFEIDLATGKRRQVTRGKYDDVDGRYLPSGDLLFLSTRKGRFLQTNAANTQQTLCEDLPDSYVRCGGDDYRPVPVFTLHEANRQGSKIWPVSAFETFEYSPSIANDGRLLYCRWDYIDRFNGHFFSLWSANQDGSNSQLVYGNFTKQPQATMEPRSVPNSHKILFTAAAHHSITGGSLVLLDTTRGNEGFEPITRVTPEVPFPETESNVGMFYANPWPLSEDFYLVSWSDAPLPPHGRYEDERNPVNSQGIYLCDRFGNLELLYRDKQISSMSPIPIRTRPRPPIYSQGLANSRDDIGTFVIQNVYEGLIGVPFGQVCRIRIVGVVPKVQPNMNTPNLGVSREETGKFVLGSVPVEADGSAHFQLPAGLPVFFQALDARGRALQTMRSLTYLQPGQTLACVGCHERRNSTPVSGPPLALRRAPSKIRPGAIGSWPLRFDTLVQPVLNKHCISCHQPDGEDTRAASLDLRSPDAWQNLLAYADNDLQQLAFERDASLPGHGPAIQSKLLQFLEQDTLHRSLDTLESDWHRVVTWMDTYAQTQGSFSVEQEAELQTFRDKYRDLFE